VRGTSVSFAYARGAPLRVLSDATAQKRQFDKLKRRQCVFRRLRTIDFDASGRGCVCYERTHRRLVFSRRFSIQSGRWSSLHQFLVQLREDPLFGITFCVHAYKVEASLNGLCVVRLKVTHMNLMLLCESHPMPQPTLKWGHLQLVQAAAALDPAPAVGQLACVEAHWEWLLGNVPGERHTLVFLGMAVVREVLVLAATGGRNSEAEL